MAKDVNMVKVVNDHGPLGWVLFTAYIGAAVHFYQVDPGFWGFFLALIKAIFWPGFVAYEVLGLLGVS